MPLPYLWCFISLQRTRNSVPRLCLSTILLSYIFFFPISFYSSFHSFCLNYLLKILPFSHLSHTLGSNGNDPTKLPQFPQQAAPSFSEPEALRPLRLRHRSLGTAYRCISFATLEHPVTYLHVPYLHFNTFLTRHLQMSIELLFGDIRAVRILGHVGMLTLVLSLLNHL